MAWRAASCTASRSLPTARSPVSLSTTASFAVLKTLRISRSSGGPPRAFRIQVYEPHTDCVEQEVQGSVDECMASKWKIKMLYDGECPLCMREVNMLKEKNKPYGSIKFVDISSKYYSPQDNGGLDYKTVMGRIHAILSDGTVITDVEAFRRLYEEVGLGWVYAITNYEPIGTIANSLYGIWAKYRLQITGRPPLENILEERNKKMGEMCNNDKVCRM